MHWYLKALKQYAVFSGRARRSEYWFFALFSFLISLVLMILDVVAGIGFLGLLYSLATLLPGLGVTIRRLHDTGRSGWWLLIGLVPLGFIVLIVFAVQDSQPNANQYGANPKV